DPDCRRGGIGSALLAAMIEAFRQEGGQSLFLEVRASNLPARSLYEKFGFTQIGIRRNYYQQPQEDGLVYCLEVHS
ncbi:MAG: GNAT family N-acetyltransferase, partial [Clostridia bacterium]|nr:GNAT family N-acetyltransferase [Clostridia bacterium]